MSLYKSMKINGRYLSVPITGVQRVALELTRGLARFQQELNGQAGLRASIIAPKNADPSIDTGVPVDSRSLFVGQAWEQAELPARARGSLLLNLCNLGPVISPDAITMIHDAQVFTSPGSYSRAFRALYETVQPRIGRSNLRILTVSAFSARELAHWRIAPAEKIRVIHNGVDHVLAVVPDPDILQRLALSAQGFVLALASIQAHKNIETLLRVWAGEGRPDVPLVLVGAANAQAFSEAGMEIPAGVIFAGRVSDGELRALMEAALCFARPSLTEGFGLPPLEAMLLGCPAIVSARGALPEVCGEAALYPAAENPSEWRDAIAALAGDREKRAHQKAIGLRHAAGFTWDKATRALIDVLAEVVNR